MKPDLGPLTAELTACLDELARQPTIESIRDRDHSTWTLGMSHTRLMCAAEAGDPPKEAHT